MNTFAKVKHTRTYPNLTSLYVLHLSVGYTAIDLVLVLKGLVEFGLSRRTIEFHDPALAYYSLRVSLRNEATEKKE